MIDDGSTDGTAELIAKKYGNEPRGRYVQQANAGVATARNHGLRIAQGDFVALLDSDDLWHPWKLEAQLAVMHARPEVGMVWTNMEAVNDAGEQISKAYLRTMLPAAAAAVDALRLQYRKTKAALRKIRNPFDYAPSPQ